MSNNENDEGSLRTVAIALLIAAITIAVFMLPTPAHSVPKVELEPTPQLIEEAHAQVIEHPRTPASVIRATVTGYNTVPEQTDATPCIAASGDNICGRTDVVACPRVYPLGTQVVIDGATYVCLDRTAAKYDGRWDISCDKDEQCPRLVQGVKEVHIISEF